MLTHDPIDMAALLASVESPRAGAVVLFLGVTREFTGERQTTALNYECYPEMADRKIAEGLIRFAHENICPYSHATRGNVEVSVALA